MAYREDSAAEALKTELALQLQPQRPKGTYILTQPSTFAMGTWGRKPLIFWVERGEEE